MKIVNKKRSGQIREINLITDCLNGEMRRANLTEDRIEDVRNEVIHIIHSMRIWNQKDENKIEKE